jgi:hypothetical protein
MRLDSVAPLRRVDFARAVSAGEAASAVRAALDGMAAEEGQAVRNLVTGDGQTRFAGKSLSR